MKRLAVRNPWLVLVFGALAALSACSNTSVDAEAADASPASQPPTVRAKSYPLVVREGSAATFTVTATGAGPTKYQWQRDGIDIAGATERSYVVWATARADDASRYSVRISNAGGQTTVYIGELLVVGIEEPMPWL